MENLFSEQLRLVNDCFTSLDVNKASELAHEILQTSRQGGLLHFTGMGKSGIISKYLSQMFASIGMPASFLSPTDAFHGDLGMIRNGDLVIMISRSGQTGELVSLLPMILHRKIKTWAIVCNGQSKLAVGCDAFIELPLEKELCPFDSAPVTSSVLQVFFGSVVLASIMRECGIEREEYAQNHPGGRIGKRLILRVRDVMKDASSLARSGPDVLLMDKISQMSRAGSGCLMIVDNLGKLLGIFTDGDLRRALEKYGNHVLEQPMSVLMTRSPKVTHADEMAYQVMMEMESGGESGGENRGGMERESGEKEKRVKEMPVVDSDGRLVGLVTLHDLVNLGL